MKIGKLGEDIACKYLESKDFSIIERNYRKRFGEIDIIALIDDDFLVFVEVKARTNDKFGDGFESVNRKKQLKLLKTAYFFLKERKLDNVRYRFDVLSLKLDFQARISQITHFKNAISDIK